MAHATPEGWRVRRLLSSTHFRPEVIALRAFARERLMGRFPIGVVAVCLGIIAALWIALFFNIHLLSETATDEANHNARNLAAAYSGHIRRTIGAIDQLITTVAAANADSATPPRIPQWAKELPLLKSMGAQMQLIGADGTLRDSTIPFIDRPNLSDRPYFRYQLERNTPEPFIGAPMIKTGAREGWIHISRRITLRDGRFGGIVVASLESAAISQFFDGVDLGHDGAAVLVGSDGIVRAWRGPAAGKIGENIGNSTLFRRLQTSGSGYYTAHAQPDRVERTYGYAAVPDYPLVVAVGFGLDEVLANIDHRRPRYYVFGTALSIFIIALGILLAREVQKRQEREIAAEVDSVLREQRALLDLALNTMRQGLVMFRKDGRVLLLNRSYIEMYRLSPDRAKPDCTLRELLEQRTASGTFAGDIDAYIRSFAGVGISDKVFDNPDGRSIHVVNRALAHGGWVSTHEDITEAVQAERELRESQEALRREVERANEIATNLSHAQRVARIGSAVLDFTTGKIEWSEEIYPILGLEPGSPPNYEQFRDLVHLEDRGRIDEAANAAEQCRPDPSFEYRIVRPDGEVRVLRREAEVIRGSDGAPLKRITTILDVTELRDAERELRASREMLLLAQRTAGIGSVAINLVTGESEWSDEFYRVHGLDKATTPPTLESTRRHVHPIDLAAWDEHVASLRRGNPGPLEFRFIRPDGRTVILREESDVICDERGRPLLQITTVADVTAARMAERRQAELEHQARLEAERLRTSEAHLARAQHLAGIGSVLHDLRTGDSEWSAGIYRILGLDPQTPPNLKAFRIRVHPDDLPLIEEAAERSIAGLPDRPFEYRIVRPNGEMRIVERESETILDESGNQAVRITIMRDVTEERIAEKLQSHLERQLQHSQKLEALGTLAGGIAHDLNNTLLPIITLSELCLKDLSDDAPMRDDLVTIVSAAARARDLVKRVLAFARKQELVKEPVDLAAVLREALRMMRATVPAAIRIDEQIDEVPMIMGDSGQLHQVIVNLFTNAAQAIGVAPGNITVSLCSDQAGRLAADVLLSISDTGCGMSEETVGRIFEPFYTTKSVGEGTGLGLSVAHGIIVGHGGTIEVRSKLAEGTGFTIRLPISADAKLAFCAELPTH
jgi:PAS domain S-box-containing protein